MTALLVALTVVEIAVVVTVLVVYLVAIARSLRRTAQTLAKVSFGVRAIETQCSAIGPSVLAVNSRLSQVSSGIAGLVELAAPADGSRTTGGRT